MKTPVVADFTGQDIYVGVDIHRKRWQVSVFFQLGEHQTFSQEAGADQLVKYLERSFPQADLRSVYEAGFSGFWLAHYLEERGIETLVVHPADIPTQDKERRYKRNKTDARKLARTLKSGDLTSVFIPTEEQIADRMLVRARGQSHHPGTPTSILPPTPA